MGLVRRWGATVIALAAAVVGALFRIPAFNSTRHLNYDDGVYAASVHLMREGLDPFADFFSSQGPVFLPVLRLADMTGIGDIRAARLAMVATGAALAVAMYLVVRRDHDGFRAGAAALLTASSGILLFAAGPLHSDGLALAIGLLAVAIAAGDIQAKAWLAPLSGVVIALGLATKSLHLLPTALVVATLVVQRGSRRALVAFGIGGAVTGLVVSLPWGLTNVWEQYVVFHLNRRRPLRLGANLDALWELLKENDRPLLILLAMGLILTVLLFRSRAPRPAVESGLPFWLLMAWATSTLLMIVFITGVQLGFERFAAFLIPPLILLIVRFRLSSGVVLVFAILAVAYQWDELSPRELHPGESRRAAIEILQDLPKAAWVVTDDPGVAWSANRLSHPDTVDSSLGRLETGSLRRETVSAALADEETCAFMAWSGRYRLARLATPPSDFTVEYSENERILAIRPGC